MYASQNNFVVLYKFRSWRSAGAVSKKFHENTRPWLDYRCCLFNPQTSNTWTSSRLCDEPTGFTSNRLALQQGLLALLIWQAMQPSRLVAMPLGQLDPWGNGGSSGGYGAGTSSIMSLTSASDNLQKVDLTVSTIINFILLWWPIWNSNLYSVCFSYLYFFKSWFTVVTWYVPGQCTWHISRWVPLIYVLL